MGREEDNHVSYHKKLLGGVQTDTPILNEQNP